MDEPLPEVIGSTPAAMSRRVCSFLLDSLASAVAMGVVSGALVLAHTPMLVWALTGIGAGVVIAVVQSLLLGAKGWTLGKRALGLRVVDVATGAPVGFARALTRSVLLGLFVGLCVPAVVLLVRLPRDPAGQGWHDKAARSVEMAIAREASVVAPRNPLAGQPVPGRPVPDQRVAGQPAAASAVPGHATSGSQPHDPTRASAIIAPVPGITVSPTDPAAVIAPAVVAPRADGGMVGPPPGLVSRPAPERSSVPPQAGKRMLGAPPMSPAPAPGQSPSAQPPTQPPVQPPTLPPTVASPKRAAPVTPVPAEGSGPSGRSADPHPLSHPATRPVRKVTPQPAPQTAAQTAAPSQASNPAAQNQGAQNQGQPDVQPTGAPTRAEGTVTAEETGCRWRLRLSAGPSRLITHETLIGRDPDPALRPGATLLAVADPAFTVSKTHAVVTPWDNTLWLEDLDSTHGVVLRRGAAERRVDPGTRARLRNGDTIVLGVFELSVEEA